MPKIGKDLVENLLVLNPQDRLSIEAVKSHEFFNGLNFDEIMQSESPLCTLYNLIQEEQVELCSSDSDSFANDDSFDKNFRRSTIGIDDEEVQIKEYREESNLPNSRPSEKSFKKSSSLGEKCILELIPPSEDADDHLDAPVEPPKLGMMVDHKLMVKTNKSQ